MDRRPLLARRFAEVIYDNMIARGLSDDEKVRAPIVDEWTNLILTEFKSDSIPYEDGDGIVTSHSEGVVAKFLDKFPEIRPAMEAAKAIVEEVLPEPIIRYHLHSDPEGCHICTEGQHIVMEVYYDGEHVEKPSVTGSDIDWEAFRAHEVAFEERWLFPDDSPYNQLGERRDLLLVTINPWLP